ncbi:DinB family protein [Nesterenkonia alkaliphila]|uniref:DUF664 domain-containing protein n=1 Tax=Nesterenkonia alkaliphila TaxID=1463631 RepID=A0A7K1UEG8_9MICC|nr:DinB family protein [Nesterenkonia alkaliphila]MVT24822.1 DUF664 domain-containing protein [Nesterenkonia alkaliphila]GFZ93583.1 mini-circle protein [Nesterenkonia alkaliphila]
MTQMPPRQDPPLTGTEPELLTGFLDFHRQTLRGKCSGLTREQLNTALPPSSMTLAGLLKHLALVEDNWLSYVLHAAPEHEYWAEVDWEADPDWDWNSAVENTPEELFALWESAVSRSGQLFEQALAAGGLDQPAARPTPSGKEVSLRWILIHLIEEYARHNGHADLIRESLDGSTGE